MSVDTKAAPAATATATAAAPAGPSLTKCEVYIGNPKRFAEKRAKFIAAGLVLRPPSLAPSLSRLSISSPLTLRRVNCK